ncbi:hypothetical protein LCGC14_1701770 [marine sediment metagenome]|uniref:Uncharacterized protein n=1 Tax=marine sediment metagenome TaxID=412755 RepID=A0A0F9HHH3_9ZZZZ
MAVDLNEILMAEQGACIQAVARAHAQQMDFQAKVFTRLEASIDLVEASAAQFLGKAGENPRYQPQSSPPAV